MECEYQFRNELWNCSDNRDARGIQQTIERGSKETAFLYAVTSAGVVHTIARDCASGRHFIFQQKYFDILLNLGARLGTVDRKCFYGISIKFVKLQYIQFPVSQFPIMKLKSDALGLS